MGRVCPALEAAVITGHRGDCVGKTAGKFGRPATVEFCSRLANHVLAKSITPPRSTASQKFCLSLACGIIFAFPCQRGHLR